MIEMTNTLCFTSGPILFTKNTQQFNGRSAYTRVLESSAQFLYYLSTAGVWGVSTTLGDVSVSPRASLILAPGSFDNYEVPTSGWEEWCNDACKNSNAVVELGVCASCQALSSSPAKSTALLACTCNASSTGLDGGSCSKCNAGKFKISPGSAPCSTCVSGKYSTGSGVTSASLCFEAGKYKVNPGCSICTNCIAGQYSTAVAAISNVCKSCPPPQLSDDSADCVCIAGFSAPNGGVCSQCIAGKYKINIGNAACSNCAAQQYSTAVGATSDVCQMCNSNSNSPLASNEHSDCICDSRYTGLNGGTGSCIQCVAGKFKTQSGSAACTNCVS